MVVGCVDLAPSECSGRGRAEEAPGVAAVQARAGFGGRVGAPWRVGHSTMIFPPGASVQQQPRWSDDPHPKSDPWEPDFQERLPFLSGVRRRRGGSRRAARPRTPAARSCSASWCSTRPSPRSSSRSRASWRRDDCEARGGEAFWSCLFGYPSSFKLVFACDPRCVRSGVGQFALCLLLPEGSRWRAKGASPWEQAVRGRASRRGAGARGGDRPGEGAEARRPGQGRGEAPADPQRGRRPRLPHLAAGSASAVRGSPATLGRRRRRAEAPGQAV
jgi:hypothetical protein